jgi:hypothetical protein
MSSVNRENALWALQRAMAYAKQGDMRNAVNSAVSDLEKIGATRPDQGMLTMMILSEARTADEFETAFRGFASVHAALQVDRFE